MSDCAGYPALLQRLYGRTRGGGTRDPVRTRRLLDRLGIPDPMDVVHVVGTNGKGSVTWRIDAGLRAAGATSLRFLSPHVERFEERIAVAGDEITAREVSTFLTRAWHEEAAAPAAFFELCTALALDMAARRSADWAVLEAGVGAARDATMAIGNVRAVVITDVNEDHLEAIGPDLAAVARDKAEAIRPGTPVITGASGGPLAILREVAAQRGAPLWVRDDADPRFAVVATGPEPRRSAMAEDVPDAITTTSASLAAAALRALFATIDVLPADRSEAALRAAAVRPELPARRERFVRADRTVLLDGAHNPAAATALAAAVAAIVAADRTAGHHLLLGVLTRKDPVRMAEILAPAADRVTLTAAEPGERPWGDDPRFVADAERALHRSLEALPRGGLLVLTGSMHLAGRLRPRLRAWAAGAPRPVNPTDHVCA